MAKTNEEQFEVRRLDANYFGVNNEIIDDERLVGAPLLVYVVLCRFSNHRTQECYPSTRTVAQRAGLNKSTVSRAMKKLEKMGFIRRKLTPGKNTIYTMLGVSANSTHPKEVSALRTKLYANKTRTVRNRGPEQYLYNKTNKQTYTGEGLELLDKMVEKARRLSGKQI